jgi:cobalt-precorrin 5A hydrolase
MERHPMIVAGLGFRGAASQASLAEAVGLALAQSGKPLDALATASHKANAAALCALAADLGLPIHAVDVSGQATPTQSARVMAGFETGSVAEAAALVAAGQAARLVVGRVVSSDGMATAAIAEGRGPNEGVEP